MNELIIRRIDDLHHHFRIHPTLTLVLQHLLPYCARAIAMPNLSHAVLNGLDVVWYRNMFTTDLNWIPGGEQFEPLMTVAIRDSTTREDIYGAYETGAVAGKIYPLGVTTNSENGLRHFFSDNMLEVYQAMQEVDMLLLHHGEIDGDELMYYSREDAYLPIFQEFVSKFPHLKQVFEHISTKNGVDMIKQIDSENVAASITAHHLAWTGNDVLGNGCHPHKVCMPCLKEFRDRDALIEAATTSDPHFFFGSDSAPHPVTHKESSHGKCGAFTVPHALPMLADMFEKAGALHRLEDFTSRFGAEFYGLPLNEGTVTLKREVWTVPDFYGDENDRNMQFVPPNAGETLNWQLVP